MHPSDEDRLERTIEEWSAKAAEKVSRYQLLQQKLGAINITEKGLNGGVEVTVGHTGTISDMKASDELRGVPPSRVVQELLGCMRRAQAKLATQVAATMQETVGEDTESVRAVVDSFNTAFPQQDEDEEEDDVTTTTAAATTTDGDNDDDDYDEEVPWRRG